MKIASDWATKQYEVLLPLSATGKVDVQIASVEMLAFEYHRQLTALMKRGKLPPEPQENFDDWVKTLYKQRAGT